MPTTLALTPQPGTASVLVQVAGAPSPGLAVYSQSFETSTDAWTLVGTGWTPNVVRDASGRTGTWALDAWTDEDWADGAQVQRAVSGLTVGTRYRLSIHARKVGASGPDSMAAAVDGRGQGPAAATSLDDWTPYTFDFTAASTTHTIALRKLSGAITEMLLDDVTLTVLPGTSYRPLTITRTDVNGSAPVRLLDGQEPSGGSLIVTDYEPALTGTAEYLVVDGLGVAVTATTTLDGQVPGPWLGVPVMPQLGLAVPVILDDYSASQDSRGTLHPVIDRPDPVPTLGPLSTRTGALSVLVPDHATARQVAAVYDRGHVVHLRQPTHDGLDSYHVGTRVAVRPDGPRWRVNVDFTEVARPIGPLLGGLGWDFAQVAATYADFAAVRAAHPDFASLTVGPL